MSQFVKYAFLVTAAFIALSVPAIAQDGQPSPISFSGVGDVVTTTRGPDMPTMRSWDGWGDWNLSWAAWSGGKTQTGGIAPDPRLAD